MQKRIAAFMAIASLVWAGPARGDGGGATSPFSLGAGSRSLAMGGAAAAVWGDSYALFWNPAGLWHVDRDEVNVFHTSLHDESTTYSAVALAHPFLQIGVISIGAVQLRVDGIERRDASNMLIAGELTNVQTRYILGYARNIAGGLTAGFDLKLDRYSLAPYSANGFGLDAGVGLETAVHSPAVDGIAIGTAVTNVIEPTINLVSQEAGDPRGVRAGLSAWRSISSRLGDRLMLAVDVDKTRYSELRLHAGGEYRLKDVFAVRGGWDAGSPTFGCGIRTSFMLLDYAYRSTELGGAHFFSLSARFGASRSDRERRERMRRDEELRREIDVQIARYESRSIRSALDEGGKALDERKYERAMELFERALLWAPANEEAKQGLAIAGASLLTLRGDSLAARGRLADALISYREAQGRYSAPALAERIGRCERAMQEASNRDRSRGEMLDRAMELYTERKWSEAALGFEAVIVLDPQNGLARSYLARTREKMRGEYEKILSDADGLAARGRYAAAGELLRAALETRAGDARLASKLAEVEAAKRDAESKAAPLRAGPERPESIPAEERERLRAAYDRGIDLFKRADFARAISEWESVYRSAPRFELTADYLVKAYQYLGMEQYARHEYEKALDTWNKILSVDPDNEKALRYIGKTREELSRLDVITNR